MYNFPTLNRIDSPEGRFYETPSGNRYPSVTSVLGVEDDGSLDEWRKAVGEEVAKEVSARACKRGTEIHSICERHLKGETITFEKHDFLNKSAYKNLVPVLNRVSNIACLETPLYSDKIKSAGTVDCIAELDGKLTVIDWKTSAREKYREQIPHYFIQASAYAYMFYEHTKIQIPTVTIVISVDHSLPLIYSENTLEWFPKYIEIRKKYFEKYSK